jgi:hypothetical protein
MVKVVFGREGKKPIKGGGYAGDVGEAKYG